MACMAQRELIGRRRKQGENVMPKTPTGKRKPGPIVRQASAAPKHNGGVRDAGGIKRTSQNIVRVPEASSYSHFSSSVISIPLFPEALGGSAPNDVSRLNAPSPHSKPSASPSPESLSPPRRSQGVSNYAAFNHFGFA